MFTLSEAVDKVPPVNGKTDTTETLRRWCTEGVRGERLHSRFIGGRRVVSEEDIAAFLADLSQGVATESPKQEGGAE